MAETDIRTCPHCGVSISWNTPYCPNCDEKLEIEPASTHDADDSQHIALDDAQIMTVLTNDDMDADEAETLADELPAFPSKLPEYMATEPPIEPDDTNNLLNTPHQEVAAIDLSDLDHDETVAEADIHDFATELGELPPETSDESEDIVQGSVDRTVTMVDGDADLRADEEVDVEAIAAAESASHLPETKQDIPLPYHAPSAESSDNDALPDIKTRGLPANLNALGTLPASHSAIAGSSPVAPAARVPEPEPLPPLDTRSGQSKEPTHQIQAVVIPSAPFTPPPPVANYHTAQQPSYQQQPISPYTPQSGQQAVPYSHQQGYQQNPYAPQQGYQQPQYMQPAQSAMPNDYWLNQRVQVYQMAGYELIGRNQYEGLLRQSKILPFFWWVVAGWTGFGAAWYFLMLMTSGFKKDKVYIGLEPDGYIFEEGAGSAHIRRKRERSGRRWGMAGLIITILSTIMFFMLLLASYFILDSYSAELNEAFPAVTLFQDYGNDSLNEADVENAKNIAFVMMTLFSLSFLGLLSGYILAAISYIQAAAYRVNISPLPGYD